MAFACSHELALACWWVQTEGKAYQETWLLLEFCDRGSLQDAMDRGAFRAVRLGATDSMVRAPIIVLTQHS